MNLSQFVGAGLRVKDFTSSGTWTIPAGVRLLKLLAIGGGGSGGAMGPSFTPSNTSAFFGGGGGRVLMADVPLVGGEEAVVTIGSGGASVTASGSNTAPGNDGGTTTVNVKMPSNSNNARGYFVANGGGKGGATGSSYTSYGIGGGKGVSAQFGGGHGYHSPPNHLQTNEFFTTPTNGGVGYVETTISSYTVRFYGGGHCSGLGGDGSATGAGADGSGYGSGGGAGRGQSGAGAPGIVIIWY